MNTEEVNAAIEQTVQPSTSDIVKETAADIIKEIKNDLEFKEQIKQDILKQVKSISRPEQPTQQPEFDYRRYVEGVIVDYEENKAINGTVKHCLRRNGVDVPDEEEFKKHKIITAYLYGCPIEDIVDSVKKKDMQETRRLI